MSFLHALLRPAVRRRSILPRLIGLLGLFWLLSGHALAGSLQVSPILLEFAPGQQSQGVWLSNSGSAPIRAQVRVQAWSQQGNTESLVATDALVASPPILEIASGQQQLVRIVRPQAGALSIEQSYRLLVDELPASDEAANSGLQFLLRYSVPVFLLPQGAVPQLERTGARGATDVSLLSGDAQISASQLVLTLRNSGSQRIRLSQLQYRSADGKATSLAPGLLGYVLAGQQMQWSLPLATSLPPEGRLEATLNDDPDFQALPVQGAGR